MAYFLKAVLIVIHLKLNKKCAGVSREGKEHEDAGASQWPALSPAPTAPHTSSSTSSTLTCRGALETCSNCMLLTL